MLKTLTLLLPALVPSWRFFDVIAPSPRIEFVILKNAKDTAKNWQEFRPRPAHLSIFEMLKRMIWNPAWNESLFLVSCAERIMEKPERHIQQEITNRIWADLKRNSVHAPFLQFRLVFVCRAGRALQKDVTFTSPVHKYKESVQS